MLMLAVPPSPSLLPLLQESSYVFRDGMLPPHRQMFYQLCDLDVERYSTVRQLALPEPKKAPAIDFLTTSQLNEFLVNAIE